MAEQKKTFGDFEIHYIGLNSTNLSPDVARQYGIKRSANMGYVSLSVLNKNSGKGLDANVSGDMINMLGQYKSLQFKRVQEGAAIYFLTTFDFDEEEVYKFDIKVNTHKPSKKLTLKFKQRFYK